MTYALQPCYPLPFAKGDQPRSTAGAKAVSLIVFVLLLLAMASQDGCPLEQPPPPPPPPDYPWPEPKGDQSGPWEQNAALLQAWDPDEQASPGSQCPHSNHPGHIDHPDNTQSEYGPMPTGGQGGLLVIAAFIILLLLALADGGQKAPAELTGVPAADPLGPDLIKPRQAPPLHEYGKNPWEA